MARDPRHALGIGMLALTLVGGTGAARADGAADARIRALEQQLRELKAAIEQQKAAGQAAQKEAREASEQARTAVEAAKKRGVSLPDWLQRTTVFGDVR